MNTADVGNEWPAAGLDVEGERRRGWRPRPLSQFVLKLVGACNLDCDYCYVYRGADTSWRLRPPSMPAAVISQAGLRIAEHAERHGVDRVRIVLHGGEPLLLGAAGVAAAVERLRSALPDGLTVEMSVQTNATLLDDEMLDVLDRYRVRIGVSLDGGPEHNDHHRTYGDGRGSYQIIEPALRRLSGDPRRHLFAGILCTLDPDHDPDLVYDALIEFRPPAVDFLLPHRTWATNSPTGAPAGRYGAWLARVFDRWAAPPQRQTDVRLFTDILRLLRGGTARSDQVGLSPVVFVVVDTDGTLQQVDALKVVAPGAPETGLNVFDHALEDVCVHPAVVARQIGLAALAPECRTCRLVRVCGAGHYTHRYRPGTGFRNPSVYCPDLMFLIDHIVSRIAK